MQLDWHTPQPLILINPRTPHFEMRGLQSMISEHALDHHIFLATSGSTAICSTDVKWVALKKEAFLNAAQGVNLHLDCTKKDIFLNALPVFHVGGLALFARSFLLNAKIINLYNQHYKWNPIFFIKQLESHKVTISSLVPTQVYDLVQNNLTCPKSVRAIIVGGGALNKKLYEKAHLLNWPLLPSYGMTECCSQVATAAFDFQWENDLPQLTVLSHLQVSISNENKICIKGDSLLTGYIFQKESSIEFVDPKVNQKIITSDLGTLKNNKLVVYGRENNVIKINGENISLDRLDQILQNTKEKFNFHSDAAIYATQDDRAGHKIHIAFLDQNKNDSKIIQKIVSEFNQSAFPFEKIQQISFVKNIPRSELGKLKRNLLLEMCNNRSL